MHIWVDHTKQKIEIQAEQVQWVFGGPQASSYEDANIVVIKASSDASNHHPWVLLVYILIMNLACALSCRSWSDA
jgi:hypothetical protein